MTTDAKAYAGGCHCGAVRYEITADLRRVTSCNCSICTKKGFLLTFVGADEFALKSGDDELSEYLFNKKHIRHVFCRVCGVESFATGSTPDGRTMYAINVRCLDGVDASALAVDTFDGASA